MQLPHLIFGTFVLFLSACGGGPNPDNQALENIPSTQNVSGEKFEILSSADYLTFGDGTLSGSGTIRFADSLGSTATNFNYEIVFSLEDGGEFTLVSHSNQSLTNGVELKFKRNAAILNVTATAAGMSEDWSSFFTDINATAEMKISIDVHNDEPLTHLVYWNNLTNAKLLDSADDVDGCPGKGMGQHWGLRLANASVSSIQRSDARDAH